MAHTGMSGGGAVVEGESALRRLRLKRCHKAEVERPDAYAADKYVESQR